MISKKNIASIWVASFIIIHIATFASDRFIAGIADLPLIPGLYLVNEETVIFEKPTGRIVRAIAKGRCTEEAFWQFYEDALPQLGWQTIKRGRFVRDGETLNIKVEENGSQIIARFSVAPASKQ